MNNAAIRHVRSAALSLFSGTLTLFRQIEAMRHSQDLNDRSGNESYRSHPKVFRRTFFIYKTPHPHMDDRKSSAEVGLDSEEFRYEQSSAINLIFACWLTH